MKECPQCSQLFDSVDKYCRYCGVPLKKASDYATSTYIVDRLPHRLRLICDNCGANKLEACIGDIKEHYYCPVCGSEVRIKREM